MSDWSVIQYDGIDHLEKTFVIKKYSRALALMNAVAGLAESYIHHPRMVLEWGKLTIAWGTHESDEGSGILGIDRFLADQCDILFDLLQKKAL